MRRTQINKKDLDLGEIINMFWDNHNRNEGIIKALINYQDKEPQTFNFATIKKEPKIVDEKKNSVEERMKSLIKSIKITPIELGLTELPKEDNEMKDNHTYQALNSCFYHPEEDKSNVKPISYYINKIPFELKINEKRLAYIFSKIREKWVQNDYLYSDEVAFKVFELKNYNSQLAYRFVTTKQFKKFLVDYYKNK